MPLMAFPVLHVSKSLRSDLVRNGAANAARVAVFGFVGFVLPAVLVRSLPAQSYNAWLLLLQLGAYISFLDFGIQTAVSKYVAEFAAISAYDKCSRIASNAVILASALAAVGLLATVILAACVPHLFSQIPPALFPQVRWGLVFIAFSSAVALPVAAIASIYIGLQRSIVPVTIQSATKVVVGAVTIFSVLRHFSLLVMAGIVAAANLVGSAAQILLWYVKDSRVYQLRWSYRDLATIRQLAKYCSALGVWWISMLFIGGLDTIIVAHYDFKATSFYAVSASITMFFSSLASAFCSPLLPAVSAMSANHSARELGHKLIRTSRIASVLTLLIIVPPLALGYLFYDVWMGARFAECATSILKVLLLAYAIRNLSLPYSMTVAGLGRQWSITLSPIVEAATNFTASIFLAQRYGAIGVAWGTVVGSIVGIALHLIISMQRTRDVLQVDRSHFLYEALLRPTLVLLPTLLIFSAGAERSVATHYALLFAFGVCTIALSWWVSLTVSDRQIILRRA